MSKVQLAEMKKTMRQNDLHKRLFLLLVGRPTKKGNVFMGMGVGQLHPFSCCIPRGRPIFWSPLFSVSPRLNPFLQLLELNTHIDFFAPTLLETECLLEGMMWVWWLLHTSAVFWSTGSWAQPPFLVHSWTEVDFRLQKVHLLCGWHAMFFPGVNGYQMLVQHKSQQQRRGLRVCVHTCAVCADTGKEINHRVHLKACDDRKWIKDSVSIPGFTCDDKAVTQHDTADLRSTTLVVSLLVFEKRWGNMSISKCLTGCCCINPSIINWMEKPIWWWCL